MAAPSTLDVEAAAGAVGGRGVDGERAVAPKGPAGAAASPGASKLGFSAHLAKVVLLSSVGNVAEWLDFSCYAYLSAEIGTCRWNGGVFGF